MNILHVLAGIFGILLILLMLQDAFETVALPRRVARRFRLARSFYQFTWRVWTRIGDWIHPLSRREYYYSYYGPLSLIMLLVVWAIGLITGFAFLQWALHSAVSAPGGLGTYYYLSGTTFFTLGLGDVVPKEGLGRAITVVEAGIGFGFLALVISYLPVIYQAFSRSEANISLLDARAGSPPTALELLRRHSYDMRAEGPNQFLSDWERWSAELLESHLSYPVLLYYRSQHERQSWLAALTTVLDTSALSLVCRDQLPAQTARFTFAIARHAAVDLAQVAGIQTKPKNPDRLSPEDLNRLRSELADIGITLADDPETVQHFQKLRDLYEPYLYALAECLRLPLPPWIAKAKIIDDWQTSPWEHAADADGVLPDQKLHKRIYSL